MKKYDFVIGIDPDVDKSGVTALGVSSRTFTSCSLSFADLMKYLRDFMDRSHAFTPFDIDPKTGRLKFSDNFHEPFTVIVVVEAGYLNKGNWHLKNGDSKAVSSAKGNSSGRNHEVARKIVEMARDYFGFEVVEQKPLAKCWKGKDRKITHEELAYFTGMEKKRTTQDERDSVLLAWTYATFPIKVKPINEK